MASNSQAQEVFSTLRRVLITNERVLASVVTSIVVFAYHMLYWDSFLGAPSTGMFPLFGKEILNGRIPYRDFGMIVPPLFPLKIAALLGLLGESIASLRFVCVLERALFAGLLSFWLSRVTRPSFALVGACTAGVMFSGDSADGLISYHHDAVMWVVIGGFLAALSADRNTLRGACLIGMLSGFAIGVSALTKQTVGPLAGVVIPTAVVLSPLRDLGTRWLRSWLGFWAIGALVPVVTTGLWLHMNDALWPAIEHTLLKGPSAKGQMSSIFLRPIVDPFIFGHYRGESLIVLFLVPIVAWRTWRMVPGDGLSPRAGGWGLAVSTVGIPAIVFLAAVMGFEPVYGFALMGFPYNAAMPASLYLPPVLAIGLLRNPIQRDTAQYRTHIILLGGVSMAVAYGMALSWAYYEPMAVVGLGFLIAAGLEFCSRRSAHGAVLATSALVLTVLLTGGLRKLVLPFTWASWIDFPVVQATEPFRTAQLSGLYGQPETVAFTDGLAGIIEAYSQSGDSVLVFPYQPLFSFVSGRPTPTFNLVHYVDVLPDDVVESELQRVKARPPKLIVHFTLGKGLVELTEQVHRGTGSSGMSRMNESLEQIETQSYALLRELSLPVNRLPVKVFVRK